MDLVLGSCFNNKIPTNPVVELFGTGGSLIFGYIIFTQLPYDKSEGVRRPLFLFSQGTKRSNLLTFKSDKVEVIIVTIHRV